MKIITWFYANRFASWCYEYFSMIQNIKNAEQNIGHKKPNRLLLKEFTKLVEGLYESEPVFTKQETVVYYRWLPSKYELYAVLVCNYIDKLTTQKTEYLLKSRKLRVPPEMLAYLKLRYP